MSSLPSPYIEGKVVLVIGGGGSFGTAFVRAALAEHHSVRGDAEPILAVT